VRPEVEGRTQLRLDRHVDRDRDRDHDLDPDLDLSHLARRASPVTRGAAAELRLE